MLITQRKFKIQNIGPGWKCPKVKIQLGKNKRVRLRLSTTPLFRVCVKAVYGGRMSLGARMLRATSL